MNSQKFTYDIGIVGGGGRIGLPLALMLSDAGYQTAIYDIDSVRVRAIKTGVMPFEEEDAAPILPRVLHDGTLTVHDTPEILSECQKLIFIVGTPVDEHLNPTFSSIRKAVAGVAPYFRKGQIIILRSTVFPGMTAYLERWLHENGHDIPVAFCPERVAQGVSLREFRTLPQIVSANTPGALEQVKELFGQFAPELIELKPEEAEMTKLVNNAWRYLQFATVNQFYMIATENGLDFSRILHACRHNYPRMAGVPGPGFAAGPCLVKDTMQLAAYSRNTFALGHAGMLVNEGLPYHLIEMAQRDISTPFAEMNTAILGMAFKGDCDDIRDSLAYKLKKLLTLKSQKVFCADPFVKNDPDLVSQETAIENADVIFIGAPHSAYRKLVLPPDKHIVDVWGILPSQTIPLPEFSNTIPYKKSA